jgi:serine/threonine-protein kinase
LPLEILKPGDVVEGYRVLKELGRGAASVIYAVQDPKTKQVWALKHVEKDDEKSIRFLEQAEQEYLVANKVGSNKIRRIEKIIKKKESLLGGVNDLYLVMEHVDGWSCERHPPQYFEDALYIFEQVSEGLGAMHAKGFVHADMKPNNVIVDDKLNAKIIDLGQSCKIGTIKQRIQGTPDYIAPEQVHRRAITPKTDVYNLGASLYWILTRSFIPTALAKSDKLLGSVDDSLLARPKKPSELNTRVPDRIDQLIMACVEVDPEKRPTMAQVHDQVNLVRSQLLAANELRKSGTRPRIDPEGDAAAGGTNGGPSGGSGGSGAPGGSGGPGGSRAGGGPGGSGSRPGMNNGMDGGGKSSGGSSILGGLLGLGGSRSPGGSTGVGAGKIRDPKDVSPPPIDPGPGIAEADD